jgi:hypothetical protein
VSARLRRMRPATLLLIAAAAVSAGLLIWLQSHLTFYLDEWDLLLHRRGFSADAFLRPHNEHIILAPAIVYKALQATVGMDSAAPYQTISIATFVGSAVVLFAWLRRRVGEWPALLAAILVLFLGAAWEDLLSAFQIGYFGSMAFGLAALLALERPGRRGDLLACLALVLSISFSSLGLPFALAAAVIVGTAPGRRSRIWIVAVPVLLYALWWIGWGRDADTSVSFESVAGAPGYALAGLANSISALLGLAPSSGALEGSGLDWGRPLLLVAAALAAWRAHNRAGDSRWLWAVTALMLSFWLLAAVNAALFRSPIAPRYAYVGAIFMLMVAAELLRGIRPARAALVSCCVVAAIAVAVNLINLRDGYRVFKSLSDNERGGLTGLEFARDTVAPDFLLTPENSDAPYFDYVDAASYLSAIDAFGSPGYTESELLAAPEPTRVAADKAVSAAERIALAPATATAIEGCRPLEPGATGERVLELGPGTATLQGAPGSRIEVRAGRFAPESPEVAVGRLDSGRSAILSLPPDRARTPWTITFEGAGAVRVCES